MRNISFRNKDLKNLCVTLVLGLDLTVLHLQRLSQWAWFPGTGGIGATRPGSHNGSTPAMENIHLAYWKTIRPFYARINIYFIISLQKWLQFKTSHTKKLSHHIYEHYIKMNIYLIFLYFIFNFQFNLSLKEKNKRAGIILRKNHIPTIYIYS